MPYLVEKGIPLPGKIKHDFPLDKMEVGDSFTVPNTDRNKFKTVLIGAARQGLKRGEKCNMKFITANEGTSVRVWRVE